MKSILHIVGPVHNGRQGCTRCHTTLSLGPVYWPAGKVLKSSRVGMLVVEWKDIIPGSRACGPAVAASNVMAARVRVSEGRQ